MTMTLPARPSLLVEGGLTLILGDGGAGKSHIAASAVADVTQGREPLTGIRRPLGRALCLHADDRPEVIVHRLKTAGAVLERVALAAQDQLPLSQIPAEAETLGDVALLVIDPLITDDLTALKSVLAWAGANGTAILATSRLTSHRTPAPDEFQRMARAAFVATRDGQRRFLTPVRHCSAQFSDLPMEFSIRPPLVWEPLQPAGE